MEEDPRVRHQRKDLGARNGTTAFHNGVQSRRPDLRLQNGALRPVAQKHGAAQESLGAEPGGNPDESREVLERRKGSHAQEVDRTLRPVREDSIERLDAVWDNEGLPTGVREEKVSGPFG